MTRHSILQLFVCVSLLGCISDRGFGQAPSTDGESFPTPEVLWVRKIWNAAPHNAFTDLVHWRGKLYCAFREGQGHAGDRGNLRVIESPDGIQWKSTTLLSHAEFDLRDAALSITPDDRMMVLGGAQTSADGQRETGTFVSFSSDGREFSAPEIVIPPGRWLWRLTWLGDTAYGVSYGSPDDHHASALHKTKDGRTFETVTSTMLGQGDWPTEARVRFAADGTGYCLHRRDGEQNSAMLGVAQPPYDRWQWHDLDRRIGGPNLLQLPSGHWIAAGRLYDGRQRTALLAVDFQEHSVEPLLELPSGGDTSYPGLVWDQDRLWVSYYASHRGKANIYLAQIRFPELESVTKVSNRLELLADRRLIESLDGADLRLHYPQAAESVLQFDEPWEGPFCGYSTVIQDGDLYRLYYRGLPKAGADGSDVEVTCCAESDDGIHWRKPNLGIYEVESAGENPGHNNIVLKGQTPASHNFSPFLDRNPDVEPNARYKALGGTEKGLIAFHSADGLRWNRMQEAPVFRYGIFDSQNVAFWSESEQRYVCYFRTWTGEGYSGFRSVSRTTSEDFLNWTEPVKMAFGDTPYEHLYTNQTQPYFRAPHFYVGVAARFMPGRQVMTEAEAEEIGVNPGYFGDCSEAVLLTSRGGNQYDRCFMESFIRPGLGLENWVSRTNYPALGIVRTGDSELSIYLQKNYGQPTSYLQRFVLRTDGFASLYANYQGGEMVTKPLSFATAESDSGERQLVLNLATSAAGSVRVEVQDIDGNPLPDFALDDADQLVGDRLRKIVTWKGESSIAAWCDRPVRLRFALKDADIFSFRAE